MGNPGDGRSCPAEVVAGRGDFLPEGTNMDELVAWRAFLG